MQVAKFGIRSVASGSRARGRRLALLPLLGALPGLLLACRALMEPWAQARVLFVWGVSRSPGAVILVSLSVLATLGASIAVATRGRRYALAACVHLGMALLMGFVSWAAFRMVQGAGVRVFGVVPIAAVQPGAGLRHYRLAALLVALLGVLELALARRQRRPAAAEIDRER